MKSIKIALLGIALVATVAVQQINAAETKKIYPILDMEQVVDEQKEEAIAATAIAEKKIKNARAAIDDVRQQALLGEISVVQAKSIIKNQLDLIAEIQYELAKKLKKSVDKVEGYWDSFVSGAQKLGARVGIIHTQEQKEAAQQAIKELVNQQDQLTKDYERASQKKLLTPAGKKALKKRYEAILAGLNEEIKEKQMITVEITDAQKQLYMAALVAGAVVAGVGIKMLLSPNAVIEPSDFAPVAPEVKAELPTSWTKDIEAYVPDVTVPELPEMQAKLPEGPTSWTKDLPEYVSEATAPEALPEVEKVLSPSFVETMADKQGPISWIGEDLEGYVPEDERAAQEAEETYEKNLEEVRQAGAAMIAAKEEARRFDDAAIEAEEAYEKNLEEVRQSGAAMIAAREEERRFDKAAIEAEEAYEKNLEEAKKLELLRTQEELAQVENMNSLDEQQKRVEAAWDAHEKALESNDTTREEQKKLWDDYNNEKVKYDNMKSGVKVQTIPETLKKPIMMPDGEETEIKTAGATPSVEKPELVDNETSEQGSLMPEEERDLLNAISKNQNAYKEDLMNAYQEAEAAGDDQKKDFIDNFDENLSSMFPELSGTPERMEKVREKFAQELSDFEKSRQNAAETDQGVRNEKEQTQELPVEFTPIQEPAPTLVPEPKTMPEESVEPAPTETLFAPTSDASTNKQQNAPEATEDGTKKP